LRVIEVAFRALHQLPSEAFWANEGVCQVDQKEQGHTATEDIVDKHFAIPLLKNVAGFDVSEGEGKKQNPYPDNDNVHCIFPCFRFDLTFAFGASKFHEQGRRSSIGDGV
jgi:hypothetical protein